MTKEIIENDPYKSAGVDIAAGNDLIDKINNKIKNYGPRSNNLSNTLNYILSRNK